MNVQLVLPDARFECLRCVVLERAYTSACINVGAFEWVLIAPGSVQILGLEESCEACVRAIEIRGLVFSEKVAPVTRASLVPLCVRCLVHTERHLGNGEVVVGVFKRARYTSSHCPKTDVVEVLHGDVVQVVPALHTAAAFI